MAVAFKVGGKSRFMHERTGRSLYTNDPPKFQTREMHSPLQIGCQSLAWDPMGAHKSQGPIVPEREDTHTLAETRCSRLT
jgi:hypothetical protein